MASDECEEDNDSAAIIASPSDPLLPAAYAAMPLDDLVGMEGTSARPGKHTKDKKRRAKSGAKSSKSGAKSSKSGSKKDRKRRHHGKSSQDTTQYAVIEIVEASDFGSSQNASSHHPFPSCPSLFSELFGSVALLYHSFAQRLLPDTFRDLPNDPTENLGNDTTIFNKCFYDDTSTSQQHQPQTRCSPGSICGVQTLFRSVQIVAIVSFFAVICFLLFRLMYNSTTPLTFHGPLPMIVAFRWIIFPLLILCAFKCVILILNVHHYIYNGRSHLHLHPLLHTDGTPETTDAIGREEGCLFPCGNFQSWASNKLPEMQLLLNDIAVDLLIFGSLLIAVSTFLEPHSIRAIPALSITWCTLALFNMTLALLLPSGNGESDELLLRSSAISTGLAALRSALNVGLLLGVLMLQMRDKMSNQLPQGMAQSTIATD